MPRLDYGLEVINSTFSWHKGPTTTTYQLPCDSQALHWLHPNSMLRYIWDAEELELGGQGECGCRPLNRTCNHLTLAYFQPSDKLNITACGGISLRRLRSSQGLPLMMMMLDTSWCHIIREVSARLLPCNLNTRLTQLHEIWPDSHATTSH